MNDLQQQSANIMKGYYNTLKWQWRENFNPDLFDFHSSNTVYIHNNRFDEKDYQMYLDIKRLIEERSNCDIPQRFDSVRLIATGRIDKDIKIYENAMITNISEQRLGYGNICTCPYSPYVNYKNGVIDINQPSGGYFGSWGETAPEFKYLGKKLRTFWKFGRNGAGGGQGVNILANVNHWEIESNKFY